MARKRPLLRPAIIRHRIIVAGGMVPMLKALASSDDILGTRHRKLSDRDHRSRTSEVQARDVPFLAARREVDPRSLETAMKIGAQRQGSGTASQAAAVADMLSAT